MQLYLDLQVARWRKSVPTLIINRGNVFSSKAKTQLTSEATLHPQGPSRFTRSVFSKRDLKKKKDQWWRCDSERTLTVNEVTLCRVSAECLTYTHVPVLLASLGTIASEARVAWVLIHAGGRADDHGCSYHAVFEWHFSALKLEMRIFFSRLPSITQSKQSREEDVVARSTHARWSYFRCRWAFL